MEDINKYLIEGEENCLNLLHILIGLEESNFICKCIQSLVLKHNIDINSLAKIDGILRSGAHIAVIWSHYRVLKLLIDFGIDLFICDSYGSLVNDYAIAMNDQKARLIIEEAINSYHSSNSFTREVKHTYHSFENNLSHICGQQLSQQSKEKTDFDKTVEYFDENQSIWRRVENHLITSSSDSETKSESTLNSNISYEKTESVKSFCSDKTEIYVYNDRDNNIVLIEERFEGCPHNSDVISKGSVTQNSSDSQLADILLMNGTLIFDELKKMGDSPGPVIPSTKNIYAKRLLDMRRDRLSPSKPLSLPNYSSELNLLFEDKFPFNEALKLEKQFIEFFDSKDCKQNNFNYLLIDPNISENIPLQANNCGTVLKSCAQMDTKLLIKFIKSIFYVGKGQGNRVYQHFSEALKTDDSEMCPKVKRIHEIWSTNKGVVSVHCFHGINSEEALAREAFIIESLLLQNLTNQVSGQYIRGLKWNDRKKRILGSFLLYRAFGIYLLTGERQIRPPLNH